MKQGNTREELGSPELGFAAVFYSVLGAPIAWTLHLFISYVLVTVGCNVGWRGTVPAILLVTVVLAAAAFTTGIVAYRRWSALGGGPRNWRDALADPRGDGGLLWLCGILLAALFGVVILLAGIAPLFVPLCGYFLGD